MGLFNSRSAAASSWLLMILALLLLHVQAQPSRYGSRRHNIRRINHHSSKMQSASPSFLRPISVPLLSVPILKLPPPPKKFAYAAIAPIPTKDDPNDQINGFIQLVRAKLPLYPPAPYYEPTVAPKTAAPTTKAATTVSPTTTARPKTVKTYFRPTRPYVRPPPPTAKPTTTPKAFIFKTAKPTKNPFKTIQKATKATPAPTSSAATPPLVPELAPIVDVRGVGGEMMKLGATKAIEPATVAPAVTAPAAISTAAPAVVPAATTAPAPVSTDAPATEEAVKESTPIPLSFSSFKPYQRPLYRPAIYTRPPFRPHLQYILLPKSTEVAATTENEKSIVDVRVSLPTTTEVVPEIVTEKEEVLEPSPFDDFEIVKVLSDAPEENIIPEIDEEPDSLDSTELPEVTITFEDDATDIEDNETIPETPKLFEVISSEPEVLEDVVSDEESLDLIPGLEEEVEEIAPISEVTEAQLLLKKVEPQPFKRSQEYKPVWNIHTFGHGNKNSPPRSQSYPGWPELSSTTRRSLDYPSLLQNTTLSPFSRNVPDWPQKNTTHRGYVFSKWSPQLKNDKESTTDNLKSEKPFNPEIKTVESSTKKSTKQNERLNNLRGVRKSRRRNRTSTVKPTTTSTVKPTTTSTVKPTTTSTVKPTTRRGTLPDTLTNIKITTVKPPTRSTLFPTLDEIQTRKASRERTSSETKESNSGFDTGFSSGFGPGFGDWGTKV